MELSELSPSFRGSRNVSSVRFPTWSTKYPPVASSPVSTPPVCTSRAAIADGVLYISSLSGFLHALDVNTGEELWVYDAFAAVWGSAFVVDGKVFLGDEDGDVVVLRAGRELEKLAEPNIGSAIYGAPIAANGVLFVNSVSELFALSR